MKKIEKMKKYLTELIKSNSFATPEQNRSDLISYIDIQDFIGNEEFEKMIGNIKSLKFNGIIKHEGADCKTAEIKTLNGETYFISSYICTKAQNSMTKKYIVFKPNTTINNVGNVWEKWGKGKKIFIVDECKLTEKMPKKLICTVDVVEDGKKEVNFYVDKNKWIGKDWCSIRKDKKFNVVDHSFVLKSSYLYDDATNYDAVIINDVELPDMKSNLNPLVNLKICLKNHGASINRTCMQALDKKSNITRQDIQNAINVNKKLDQFGIEL